MSYIRIVPCQCGGYMGTPCKDVFIEGIGLRCEGRTDLPNAEAIVKKLEYHDRLVQQLQNNHRAIDSLLAALIAQDSSFMPSRSSVWPTVEANAKLLMELGVLETRR